MGVRCGNAGGMFHRALLVLSWVLITAGCSLAQTPTHANVPYGSHPRQVLDFWQAKSELARTPLLFYIHGGGWMSGDKSKPDFLAKCLENGISVVAIHYRFIPDAQAEKIDPPVKAYGLLPSLLIVTKPLTAPLPTTVPPLFTNV